MLIDKDLSKKDLMRLTGISKSTIDKMGRGEYISLEVIDRICELFNCRVEEVMEHCEPKKGGE